MRAQDSGDDVDGERDLSVDLATPDLVAPPCLEKPDPHTVALYTFSGGGTTATDLTGQHPGKMVGSNIDRAPGPPGCGQALASSGQFPVSYVAIPDSKDFQLPAGAVDFWVWADPGFVAPNNQAAGLVSRDAAGNAKPGHLTVFWTAKDEIVVRLQTASKEAGRCSAPKPKGTWHHVQVSFGGGEALELVVTTGGIRKTIAARPDNITRGGFTFPCGGSHTEGIVGNNNPWVLGASSNKNTPGALDKVWYPFRGLIDSVRISDVRR